MGGPGSGRKKGSSAKMSKSSIKPKRKVKSTFVLGKIPSNVERRKKENEERIARQIGFINR